jgi:homoserine dehydrogenase
MTLRPAMSVSETPSGELSSEGTRSGALPTPAGTVNVGLLGYGTVGSAFAELLEERAPQIERLTGRKPVLSGTLTTSRGSFQEILDGAELIVELIGGTEPAREYLLAALSAGRHVVTANKQLLSQHGEELFDAARAGGAQLRFEAAVAGVVPVIRVLAESLAGAHIERVHGIVNGTTNFILSEMTRGSSYEQALAEAQRQGFAEADPSEDVSGRDAAAKMAILARLAFGTPVHLDQVPYEGIEHLQTDDLQYARELGLGLKLIGTAERRDGGLSVRVHPAFLYSGHPLASVNGPFNAVTVESDAITEITMSGPGAGGRQTASAVLGDLVSAMLPPVALSPPLDPLPLVQDVESGFYIHMEVADRPGALAAVAQVLGEQGASIKSVVQHGLGEHARLVMVIHPLAESRLREALERIGTLDFLRSTPRAIRVIEEEFM